MKEKRRWIATLLGFFGPIGTLYFGWKVALLNLLLFMSVTVISIFVNKGAPPEWFQWITATYFMGWSFFFTEVHNSVIRGNCTESEKLEYIISSVMVYIAINSFFVAGVRSYELFSDGRYFRALTNIFIAMPISIGLIYMCLSMLVITIGGLIGMKRSRS